MSSTKHIYLVGYRGSGKSTVARLLAAKTELDWIDTDDVIEAESGCSIAEIFSHDGEPAFRELETKAIQRLCAEHARVIALGGGAVLSKENRRLMRESGRVVWLDAAADVLIARISDDATSRTRRPSLTDQPMDDEVRQLIANREPLYRDASDFRIDTTSLTTDAVVNLISEWLKSLNA